MYRFKALYPAEWEEIQRAEIRKAELNAGKLITIQTAERLLGQDKIDPVCDLQTTITRLSVKKAEGGQYFRGG